MNLEEMVKSVKEADGTAVKQALRRWDQVAKPLNSLGVLEEDIVRIAGASGTAAVDIGKKAIVVMCADNGIVEEGVTQTGQEITALVAENFLQTKAVSSIMCKTVGAEIFPVDVGVAKDVSILNRKIAYGTKNMTKEPAMTREQAVRAIETGIEMGEMLKEKQRSPYFQRKDTASLPPVRWESEIPQPAVLWHPCSWICLWRI